MSLVIAVIIAVVLLSLAFWAIGYLAPADLQRPLKVCVVALFLIWLVLRLWPLIGVAG